MAATLAQIMTGVETRLQTIAGLRTNDVSPGSITPPCAIVGVPPVDYDRAMAGGLMELHMTITVLVSAAMDRAGQQALAAYANATGSSSVKAAIDAGPTLGGVVDGCKVENFRPLGLEEVGQIGYFGGVFEIYVFGSGS